MFDFNITIPEPDSQVEILVDKSSTGRERPWREKKVKNEYLSLAYDSVNPSKAERLRGCGDFLFFHELEDGNKKLRHMNSCRVRLCPLCTWRRSLKVQGQTIEILKAMDGKYSFILLTLTLVNCAGEDLPKTLDLMFDAWKRMTERKQFRDAVKGWYRALEVTHNVDYGDKSFDTYHPHFHAILVVNKSYFKKSIYVKHNEWVELWRQSIRVDYAPKVNVKKVKGDTVQDVIKATAEVAKYTVEDEDYIVPEDWDLTLDSVRILDAALNNRRLVAYGGLMKELHKKLKLDDVENGDLINVDSEDSTAASTGRELVYWWHAGYRQYIRRAAL